MAVYGHVVPGATSVARRAQNDVSSPRAVHRLKVLDWHRAHGATVSLTARHFGHARTTIERWLRRYDRTNLRTLEDRSRAPGRRRQPTWPPELVQRVQQRREEFPRWGKDKLAVLLQAEGRPCSTSMVGRILTTLRRRGDLKEPVRLRVSRRKRQPRPYAIRKPKDYTVSLPGDLLEVDTVDIRPISGTVFKHFSIHDVVSRYDGLEIASAATASLAAKALDAVLARLPFAVRAIQVDGGSEFMAEFETFCQQRGLRLFVLPPRSPKLNGAVERANRTHTEEFYELYDGAWSVTAIRPELLAWETIYNTVRPHQSLGYLTPEQWLAQHPPPDLEAA
jgi:transposase InsO family protein